MFLKVEVQEATEIYIAIPHESAASSLPAIAAMFEKNAVFVKNVRWQDKYEIVKPKMVISLGDAAITTEEHGTLMIAPSPNVVTEASFQVATPEVLISTAEVLKKHKEKIESIDKDLRHWRDRAERAEAAVKEFQAVATTID